MRLAEYAKIVQPEIEQFLTTEFAKFDLDNQLIAAMNYALMTGGKRLRPLLTLAVAETFGQKRATIIKNASAVELIHTYSLIHDDLPAMDNDTLRRGKPTVHLKFGEDVAILAGDALQPLAFEWVLAGEQISVESKLELSRLLAKAAGFNGMVAGQMLDMEMTKASKTELATVKKLHNLKTGALIAYAVQAGGILAGVNQEIQQALWQFGLKYGLAFQIKDDIDDLIQDGDEDKQAYPTLLGLTGAQKALHEEVTDAQILLKQIGEEAGVDMALLLSFLDYFDEMVK